MDLLEELREARIELIKLREQNEAFREALGNGIKQLILPHQLETKDILIGECHKAIAVSQEVLNRFPES